MKGDSCFRICQIRWIKTKKVTFSQLKTSLSRNFVYNLETFRKCIFTILLQIQHENHFLPTNKHRQAKVCRFRGIEKKNVLKRDAIMAPFAKQRTAKDIPSYRSQTKRAKIAIH